NKVPGLREKGLQEGDVVTVTDKQGNNTPNSTQVTVSAGDFNADQLQKIEVITNPQTKYVEGDALNLDNMVVKLTDKNKKTKEIVVDGNNIQELTDLGINISPSVDKEGGLTTSDTQLVLSKDDVS